MRLLLDQNRWRHLVGHLRDVLPEREHVSALELDGATHEEIWEYACEHGHLILSKDSDLRQLAFLMVRHRRPCGSAGRAGAPAIGVQLDVDSQGEVRPRGNMVWRSGRRIRSGRKIAEISLMIGSPAASCRFGLVHDPDDHRIEVGDECTIGAEEATRPGELAQHRLDRGT